MYWNQHVRLQGTYLAHDMKEFSRIEAHLEKNHYELSDLDSRRAFSILCLEQETKMILSIAGNLQMFQVFN